MCSLIYVKFYQPQEMPQRKLDISQKVKLSKLIHHLVFSLNPYFSIICKLGIQRKIFNVVLKYFGLGRSLKYLHVRY